MKYYFLGLSALVFICVGCALDGQQLIDRNEYVAPPAGMIHRPGPSVDLPTPAIMPQIQMPPVRTFASKSTQIRFVGPKGMNIGWKINGGFAENQLTSPGRYNFNQSAKYILKLTNIPGREGMVIYPSLHVYPSHPTTDAYLAHNPVPVEITPEDLDQIESNNFVSKVIYLPDPKYQEFAVAGVETLVSTRLDPGVDPVSEADRRGTIMVILRMGNRDLEMPGLGNEQASINGAVQQVAYFDGNQGQHVPPVPIQEGGGQMQVPGPMMMGAFGAPGRPPYNPISGVGGAGTWGMPMTATPIGLPGPPHLPLGREARLRSHTVRNNTRSVIPKGTEHMLIDVQHSPGIRMPRPVKYIDYKEKHPIYSPGQLSYPAWSRQ